MKLLSIIVLAALAAVTVEASVIPVHPITTTYALPAPPVATSYQVVARNVNRVVVPHVPSIATSTIAYPGYAGPWSNYPYGYRLGYGYGYSYGPGYGYPYGYGATIW